MPDIQENRPFWEAFPNMFPNAISEAIGNQIPWHTHAASPQSSQTFCVSAFGPLIDHGNSDQICHTLAERAFNGWRNCDGRWKILLEFSDRTLLNEMIGKPSQIDVLLVGPDSAITVESKLVVDAHAGLGCCGKFGDNKCKGFYGPGSDAKSPATWCLLERWDGGRSPRLYWTLGRSFFKSSVFLQQKEGETCPFRDSNYQLMRNFLLAAAYSQKKKKKQFGTLVLCPRTFSEKLASQVQSFREDVLLPEYADKVSLVYYDDYISLLRNSNDGKLGQVAEFLQCRLAAQTM
jgi:hypothetical protein